MFSRVEQRRFATGSLLVVAVCLVSAVAPAAESATNAACQLLTPQRARLVMATDPGPAHGGRTRTETTCLYALLDGRPYSPQQGLSRAFADRGKSVWLDITKGVAKKDFSIPSGSTPLRSIGEVAFIHHYRSVGLYQLEIWKPNGRDSAVGRKAEFQVGHFPHAKSALISIARQIGARY